jgi:hypothetical protein
MKELCAILAYFMVKRSGSRFALFLSIASRMLKERRGMACSMGVPDWADKSFKYIQGSICRRPILIGKSLISALDRPYGSRRSEGRRQDLQLYE